MPVSVFYPRDLRGNWSTISDIKTIFYAMPIGRFIEIKCNVKRKKIPVAIRQ